MQTEDLITTLRNPGRLCVNPTSFATAYPHGGEDLGLVRAIEVRPSMITTLIRAEEFAGAVVEAVSPRESWAIAAIIRGFNDNAISRIFPNSSVGAATRRRIIESPEPDDDTAFRGGRRLSEKAVVLCFSPIDQRNGRFVVFQKALPMLEETAALRLATSDETETGVVFVSIPMVAGKKPVQIGFIDDLQAL